MTKLKDTALLIAMLGLPIGGTWGLVSQSWTDTTWATPDHIRIILVASALIATALVVCIWWIVKQHRQLSALKRLSGFRDDCTFDSHFGIYRHPTKKDVFCGTCTPGGIESPLTESTDGWRCMVDRSHWHKNPDHKPLEMLPSKRSNLTEGF